MEDFESSQPLVAPQPVILRVSRFRWFIYLILLGSYPLMIPALGWLLGGDEKSQGPALSGNPVVLIAGVLVQLSIFFTVFGLAWCSSRVDIRHLLRWGKKGLGPIWRGVLYSVALRIIVILVVVVGALLAYSIGGMDETALRELRPKVENTIDMKVLAKSPLYLFLNVTLVSFVLAAFTEELWRVGVLAGLATLFPRMFESLAGKTTAVVLVAIVFGLGHLSQGLGGVIITTVLGVGLGAIILFHGSVWDAIIAHGCLDASTFVLLFLVFRFFPEVDFDFGG